VIETAMVRARLEESWEGGFMETAHVANFYMPAMLDELDALRAELAAEKARAERLAELCLAMDDDATAFRVLENNYGTKEEAILRKAMQRAWARKRDAKAALLPGDLGEVEP